MRKKEECILIIVIGEVMAKIVFYSNYLNHHSLPLCLELKKLSKDDFYFVAQKAISEKRIALGYQNISDDYDFVVKTYESRELLEKAYDLALEADYVLYGSSNPDYLDKRIKENKITFKQSERLFRLSGAKVSWFRKLRRVYINHSKYNKYNLYMLCSGTLAAYDFNHFGAYIGKTYKWGYFPKTIEYDIVKLFAKKKQAKINILWAGRLLYWKHPDLAIKIALKLKEAGYNFNLNIIGNGEMEAELNRMIAKNDLSEEVKMLGSMKPDEVRKYMEEANIFLFTSDFNEGWGVVLNEAMNSGCACIASHIIGSSGFLIKHEENGLIYKDGDFLDLYNKVVRLINDRDYTNKLGINAYNTILNTWNAKEAAKRFVILNECLKRKEETPFIDGPCSRAECVKEKDLYKYLTDEKDS